MLIRGAKWKGDAESGATPLLALEGDLAAVGLDDRPRDHEPEADAGDGLLCRGGRAEEALEHAVLLRLGNADAGVAHLDEGGRRFWAFPTAPSIAEAPLQALRKCGLSSRKAESLRAIARAIASEELTETAISSMSTKEALGTLVELPGIGPWSASLVLLRGLGRLDVFPPGDVGAERGLRLLLRLRSGSRIDRIVERFGAHRGYLYFLALGDSLLYLTVDELRRLRDALQSLADPYLDRIGQPDMRPPGARPVVFLHVAFPEDES